MRREGFARGVFIGFFFSLLVMLGCATTFPWRYYAEHFSDRVITESDVGKKLSDLCYAEGSLYGKAGSDGWADLPLNECKPDPTPSPGVHLKCITTKDSDFYALKADDETCHNDLESCQKQNSQ